MSSWFLIQLRISFLIFSQGNYGTKFWLRNEVTRKTCTCCVVYAVYTHISIVEQKRYLIQLGFALYSLTQRDIEEALDAIKLYNSYLIGCLFT